MRQLGLLTLVALLFASIFGLFFAYTGQWFGAFTTLIAGVLIIGCVGILTSRYLARLLRTEANKSRVQGGQFSDSVESSLQTLNEEVRALNRSSDQSSNNIRNVLSDQVHVLSDQVNRLESTIGNMAGSIRSHTTSTVQHGTSETEALLQIYTQFPHTKLPMPSSGGWAIDAESLAYLLEYVRDTKPRRILELGSGTSTIWLGYLCKSIGAELITIDHLEYYLEQTRSAVDRHGLNDWVKSRLAPLEELTVDGEELSWYSIDALSDISDIDLLIVDGPPATTGPKARFPALPQLEEQLSAESSVILDDAHRPDEKKLLDDWLTQYPEFKHVVIGTPRLAIVRRGSKISQ